MFLRILLYYYPTKMATATVSKTVMIHSPLINILPHQETQRHAPI